MWPCPDLRERAWTEKSGTHFLQWCFITTPTLEQGSVTAECAQAVLQKRLNSLKTKQRSTIKLSACGREREAVTDNLLPYFRFNSSKKTTIRLPTWLRIKQESKLLHFTTTINYILYENRFLCICKISKFKKCTQSVRYEVAQKRSLRSVPDLRHGRLVAAKTAARIRNFPFWVAHKVNDATSQTQKCGILKYYLYCLSRCNLVA